MRGMASLLIALSMLPVAPVHFASSTSAPILTTSTYYAEAKKQSPDEALAQDLGLVAEARGWTVEQAAADHYAAERIGQIADHVARELPKQFVGAALSEQPGGAPTLYIKGLADQLILDLVNASDIRIAIADSQPFSFDELEARKLRVHHALEDLGFRQVATSVNVTGGGIIPAGVTREPGLWRTVEEVVAMLPEDLRSSVHLTLSDAPVVSDYQAFGGMRVTGDFGNCTSGWSVKDIDTGQLGITTAGHCTGIDEVNHPGHGPHALSFVQEHRGQWGDVQWHVSQEREPDDFYADAANIRDTTDVAHRATITFGEHVCQYGRSSNDRDCSLRVADFSQACTNEGVFNDRLVRMNGVTSVGGDSGGGWSFGNTAFGSVKGLCGPDLVDFEVWSVADLYDEALGVRVTTGT